jgi:hypothetical protein
MNQSIWKLTMTDSYFHILLLLCHSWGMFFAAPMVGAKLILPGPWLDGDNVYGMMEDFKVTMSAGGSRIGGFRV